MRSKTMGGGVEKISCETKLSHLSENLPLMVGRMKLLANELCVEVWNRGKDDKMLTKKLIKHDLSNWVGRLSHFCPGVTENSK